jgi:hypothetical protein
METEYQVMVDTVCEAYSEHYAFYNRGAVVNMLCELYPTAQISGQNIDATKAITDIREELANTYNIRK